MNNQDLYEKIKKKKSFLCVGLDIDLDKIPDFLRNNNDPIFSFGKSIIDATAKYCIAYKPNIAFYETYGIDGWRALEKTIDYIKSKHPDIFTIADAKRCDIENTSERYAKAYFDRLNFDAITVSPYMGKDSVEPFLNYKNKHTILLALTSNPGAKDFQFNQYNGKKLYQQVIESSMKWKNSEQLIYVVGANHTSLISNIRRIVPDNFLLIPGVGAQGGNLKEISLSGMNNKCGIIVNASRSIIYSSSGKDYENTASISAKRIKEEMEYLLIKKKII